MTTIRLTRCAWLAALLTLACSACVSTTSGPVRSDPDEDDAAQQYYQLGARYYRSGNYELARDRLQRALDFNPRMAIAHSTLALTYEQLDIPRLAEEHYRLAVRYEPRNIDVRNTYAVFLCRRGDFEEAREQFDRVVRVPENDSPELALTNAGVCMAQKPDLELAETYFREALERKQNYAEALLQMILLKIRSDDLLSARAFLQRYLSQHPPTPGILWIAIEVERKMGDDRARRDYEDQLIREFPESPETRRLLSMPGSDGR
ncbi:MAG: type IV pilus biogenesis/stability protein PilW [Woeseiaceae bacterium]|nr:type IV pilus biogenesis/stability protein PilW [Woeseiaceae bacterium]